MRVRTARRIRAEGKVADRDRRQGHSDERESAVERDSLSFNLPADSNARGVIVTNADHRVSFTDSRICDLLSIAPSDLMGRDIGDIARVLKPRFADPDAFERRSEWLRVNLHETVEDVLELVSPDRRILHRYSAPLLDESRRPIGRIELYSDITRRRNLEEANAGLFAQLKSAYEELKDTQDQLIQSEKLRAVGEIAGGVAHDFNNTLGIILGNIQLLLRTVDDPKMLSRLQAMEQAALDGAETIRRIQEFTRIQPDEPVGAVDLSLLVESVVEVMKPSWESSMHARDSRVDIEFDLAEDTLAAGIAPEIREVLANILLNAVQAMPDGGTIRISTGGSDPLALVRVQDTGIGMSEDVRSRVFDPFFTTKGVEGTGLGMSVAYGIVKRHGGRIAVESELGKGTSVTVFLPAASEALSEKSIEQKSPKAVLPARILVVEDEEMFAKVFVEMLSEYGHIVCTARSGSDAIKQFRDEPFDLVFTDLGMPEMSGWQVAKSIKDMKPSTPVVLLTGWGAKVDEGQLAASQIDMILSKPVKMEELSSIISTALAGRESPK